MFSSIEATVCELTAVDSGKLVVVDDGRRHFGRWHGRTQPVLRSGVGSESLLARLNLNALAAGSYTLNLLGSSSFNDVGLNNFAFNTPSLNITVTAVPEPSSIGGAAALALGGFLFRRKRVMQSQNLCRR